MFRASIGARDFEVIFLLLVEQSKLKSSKDATSDRVESGQTMMVQAALAQAVQLKILAFGALHQPIRRLFLAWAKVALKDKDKDAKLSDTHQGVILNQLEGSIDQCSKWLVQCYPDMILKVDQQKSIQAIFVDIMTNEYTKIAKTYTKSTVIPKLLK